jgi:hypothetical protein
MIVAYKEFLVISLDLDNCLDASTSRYNRGEVRIRRPLLL